MTHPAPTPAMLRRAPLALSEVLDESHDTRTFRFSAPVSGLPRFQPGQFFALEVPGVEGWIRRSYSVSSSPNERRHLDFTIKFLDGGAATSVLFRSMTVGNQARATGPFGEFVLDPSRPALFIAGGVGITPILSMLRFLDEQGSTLPIDLLFANRARRDLLFEPELRAMAARRPSLKLHFALSRPDSADRVGGWKEHIGRFDGAAIRRLCAGMSDRTAYLCGPIAMMEETGRALLELGIPPAQIRTEAFVGVSPTFEKET